MTVLEAFACGVPVLASNLGGLSTLLTHGETGLHFAPGNAADLAAQVEEAMRQPELLSAIRQQARALFETAYTAQANYGQLLAIYQHVVGRSASAKAVPTTVAPPQATS